MSRKAGVVTIFLALCYEATANDGGRHKEKRDCLVSDHGAGKSEQSASSILQIGNPLARFENHGGKHEVISKETPTLAHATAIQTATSTATKTTEPTATPTIDPNASQNVTPNVTLTAAPTATPTSAPSVAPTAAPLCTVALTRQLSSRACKSTSFGCAGAEAIYVEDGCVGVFSCNGFSVTCSSSGSSRKTCPCQVSCSTSSECGYEGFCGEDGYCQAPYVLLYDDADCDPSTTWLGTKNSAAECGRACKASDPDNTRFVWVKGDPAAPFSNLHKNCKCSVPYCGQTRWYGGALYQHQNVTEVGFAMSNTAR